MTVTTAIPLDDELRQTITKKCEQVTSAARYSLSSRSTRLSWAAWCSRPAASVVDISVKTQLRIAQETLANSANSYGGEA